MCEKLSAMGVKLVTSNTAAEMRLCTSLVDERFGETTEIIEPWSAEVSEGWAHRSRQEGGEVGVGVTITHSPRLVKPTKDTE